MDITIGMAGGAAVAEASELREWLHDARIRGVEELEQQEKLPGPGDMGPELLPLLTVVLAAPAVVELVRSLHRYIEARAPSTTITVETDGRKVTIESRNPPSLEALTAAARALTQP